MGGDFPVSDEKPEAGKEFSVGDDIEFAVDFARV